MNYHGYWKYFEVVFGGTVVRFISFFIAWKGSFWLGVIDRGWG